MTEITSHVKVSHCQSDSNLSKLSLNQFPNHFAMVRLLNINVTIMAARFDVLNQRIIKNSSSFTLIFPTGQSNNTCNLSTEYKWLSFCKMKQAHLKKKKNFFKDWKKYFQGYFNFHSGTPKMPQNVWNLLPVHRKTKNNHPHSTVSREVARRGGGGKG